MEVCRADTALHHFWGWQSQKLCQSQGWFIASQMSKSQSWVANHQRRLSKPSRDAAGTASCFYTTPWLFFSLVFLKKQDLCESSWAVSTQMTPRLKSPRGDYVPSRFSGEKQPLPLGSMALRGTFLCLAGSGRSLPKTTGQKKNNKKQSEPRARPPHELGWSSLGRERPGRAGRAVLGHPALSAWPKLFLSP